jgi:hypothetical protein
MAHLYFGIENINLTNPQRDQVVASLQALGLQNGGPAHLRNHWRIREDNQAAIFEADFDVADLTLLKFRTLLADTFGVLLSSITSAVVTASFGAGTTQIATFTRLGTNYLRLAVFGGVSATYEESRQEALFYLAANRVAWDGA